MLPTILYDLETSLRRAKRGVNLFHLRRAKRGARSSELLHRLCFILNKFYKDFTSEASKVFVLRRATEVGPDRDLPKERGASNLEALRSKASYERSDRARSFRT